MSYSAPNWTATFTAADGVNDTNRYGDALLAGGGRLYVISVNGSAATKDVLDQAYVDLTAE